MSDAATQVAAALNGLVAATSAKKLFGIVDGARCVELAYEAQIQFGAKMYSLFAPEVQAPLWNVAPYLVTIDSASGYLHNWARRWGENAGVLVLTDADDEPLYQHLREIFVVRDDQKQEFFFRYYDPRVLRTFVPTCTPAQLREFFGPLQTILAESEDGAAVVSYTCSPAGLLERRVAVHDEERASAG